MMVLTMERVPRSLRGELTRWLIEVKTGTFVGRVSAMVRDKLWEMVCEKVKKGGALLIHRTDNEQGFNIRTVGETDKVVVDFDGLLLMRTPK